MNIKNLTEKEIQDLRIRRDGVKQSYGTRNTLFQRYEEIYFMKDRTRPKDTTVDPNDWKVTVSPGGRDKVTGLKRIMDTSEIHIKIKDRNSEDGKHANSDDIEAGLKEILKVSGEYKQARIERDTNLLAILYGPVVLSTNSVDDLLEAKGTKKTGEDGQSYKEYSAADKFVVNQLKTIRKRTPFLIEPINSRESYPVWGRYGMVGHLQEYFMKGQEVKEGWGCDPMKFKDNQDYLVQDFFYYDKRLVECNGETLFADTWLDIADADKYEGVTSIPIFVRYAGGTTLFNKPEEQLNSFLYSYATGEWDKRENLFWTYLFTAIYQRGIPGPAFVQDPEDTSEVEVDYRGGVKIIRGKGRMENIQIIDGDVMQLKNLMDQQTSQSTIQEQTIGGNAGSATFSAYVMSMNAGKLPAIDPKEAQEQAYRDCFLHILQRIKYEGIENDLIKPEDIPDDIDLEVTMEPNLQQDDLRNAQIMAQLKNAGTNVSDEWLNTNLLKIADSAQMFRQKTKEDMRKAIIGNILQNEELMQQFIMAAMGQPPAPPQPPTPPMQPGADQVPPEMAEMMAQQAGEANMEGMPMTDAVPQPQERTNGRLRPA